MRFERSLDLNLEQDCVYVITFLNDDGIPTVAAESMLERFLRWYPAGWRRIRRDGGFFPDPLKHSFSVRHALDMTSVIATLEHSVGFDRLLPGFHNPTQISATFFEARVGAWCLTQRMHEELEIGPELTSRSGRLKRPDYCWKTSEGICYLECKDPSWLEDGASKALNRIADIMKEAMSDLKVPTGLRLEVDVKLRHNKLRSEFDSAVTKLFHDRIPEVGAMFQSEACIVRLTDRGIQVPELEDVNRVFVITVGQTPVDLTSHASAHLVVSMDVARHRERRLTAFAREARKQLSVEQPNVLAVDIPGKAVIDVASRIAEQQNEVDIPIVLLWGREGLHTVGYRPGHPISDVLVRPIPE